MRLPNLENAVIAEEKLTEYLLNPKHNRGGDKARLLNKFGYDKECWSQLDSDIRRYHLMAEISESRMTPYGTRYEIRAALQTPSGRSLMVKTAWQVDTGTDFPRFITLVPD